MLANFDEARVRDIIDEQGLAKRTENTITDPTACFANSNRFVNGGTLSTTKKSYAARGRLVLRSAASTAISVARSA